MKLKDFDQIDWDRDIVEPHLKTERGRGRKASHAAQVWVLAYDNYTKLIEEEELEDYQISNIARILQYFVGKFIFYHEVFYSYHLNRELNFEEDGFTPIPEFIGLKKSTLPMNRIKIVEKIFLNVIK